MGLKFADLTITPGRGFNAHELDGYAITPSDTLATYQAQTPNVQGNPATTEGIYATGAGNIAVVLDAAGNTATLTVAAGSLIKIGATQIKATGTTATGLYALFRQF